MKYSLLTILSAQAALPLFADMGVELAELRPGWRNADGSHVAALHIVLAEGWKTYWHSPGAAGIAPDFNWSGSENLGDVTILWPVPEVSYDYGMRSIGYSGSVVIPLRIEPDQSQRDIDLALELNFGVCEDICVPAEANLRTTLSALGALDGGDPLIAAALENGADSAEETAMAVETCTLIPVDEGQFELVMRYQSDTARPAPVSVFHYEDANIWIGDTVTLATETGFEARASLDYFGAGALVFDRSALGMSALWPRQVVTFKGC